MDLPNPTPSVIAFQYNPNTLTRSLTAQTVGSEGGQSEPLRLKGAPSESIRIEVEIDATDQLEQADPTALSLGIYPQLSALELLLYPKSQWVVANAALMAAGTIEIIPPLAPLTLFIWGAKRVLPVKLTEFSITEEEHDPNLNPIRAKVSLGLQVLSYNDFSVTHQAHHLFMAHQVAKETMAALATGNSLQAVVRGNIQLTR